MTMNVADTAVGAVQVGLLGGGFMARIHSNAARAARAALRAVASASPQNAVEAAAAFGIERAEPSVADLLRASDIDVVHVCTPNATHAELALAAIQAGKHVVCEKPLATTVAQARDLVTAAEQAKVVAAVPFIYRYHPMVREARARLSGGELGTLLSIDACYLQDWMLLPSDNDWRADAAVGGPSRAFADIGSHLCDLLEFVAAEPIVRLTALTRRVFEQRGSRAVENEDIAALLVEMQSGAVGTLLISQMAAGRKNALILELHGGNGSVRFEQERPEELWLGSRQGSQLLLRDAAISSPNAARLHQVPPGHPMGYQDAFNGFIADVYDAIKGGTPEGLPSFADGLRAAVLTEAVLESAKTRSWVEVAR